MATVEDGAALELAFRGPGLVLLLDTLTPPNNYGPPELGRLEISVDGAPAIVTRPRVEDREVVVARGLADGPHRARVTHRVEAAGKGARIRGFRTLPTDSGDLAFVVTAERGAALVDVRAVLTRGGIVVRETLARNWLTGQCRLAGLPPAKDYALELRAIGWKTWRQEGIAIAAGRETTLPPAHLWREWDATNDAFKFPAPGRPIVRLRGESFRARFEAHRAEILRARLTRRHGPATISRVVRFEEDKAAAYYYHREIVVTPPADTPAGLYDLEVSVAGGAHGPRTLVSPRCVQVLERHPRDPTLLTFGHLDTWGQLQAEYLARLVDVANVIAPDIVLDSNDANPAYVAGALLKLEVPFVVNFGNHRGPEAGPWFGEPVGAVDFGAELSVVNFGRAWDTGVADVEALLAARTGAAIRAINAFEPNAPVETLLDRHRVALIHDAHGPGASVARIGTTPTLRVGKVSSESFRVVRFREGRVVSATYRGHATAPIPFPRHRPAPVRLSFEPANDGAHGEVVARGDNELEEAFPGARAVFVMPRGRYRIEGGRLESAVDSDDGRFTVVTARFDLTAKGQCVVRALAE